MAYEIRPNSGSLFRNDKKAKDTDPTHTGQLDVGGTAYWISAWVNETKDGRKYFSLKITAKDQAATTKTKQTTGANPDFNDDMPF